MFSVPTKKKNKIMKRVRHSQIAIIAAATVGSVIALFGLTTAASASALQFQSSFAPALGDHVLELARMLAAPDQNAAPYLMTQQNIMLAIVSAGFVSMLAGSLAFWNTLRRDYTVDALARSHKS